MALPWPCWIWGIHHIGPECRLATRMASWQPDTRLQRAEVCPVSCDVAYEPHVVTRPPRYLRFTCSGVQFRILFNYSTYVQTKYGKISYHVRYG